MTPEQAEEMLALMRSMAADMAAIRAALTRQSVPLVVAVAA